MHARAFAQRQTTGAVAVTLVLATMTAILAPLVDDDALLPVALSYLLVALVASAIWGWAVGILAAIASNVLVNFFFVPPLHTFTVRQPETVAGLVLFLMVAAIGAFLLSLLRRQVLLAQAARAESEILLSLSNEAAAGVSPRDSMTRLCEAITRALHASGCSILRPSPGWSLVASSGGGARISREEGTLAALALSSQTIVTFPSRVLARSRDTSRHAQTPRTYVPLLRSAPEPGVLRLSGELRPPHGVDLARLLAAFAMEASVVLHQARLHEEALRAEALERAGEFKSTLLASVSHDLRTPLTAIRTSVESLRDKAVEWTEGDRESFLATIETQGARLAATIDNLLEMSRLEGGAIHPRIEPIPVAQLYDEVALGAAPALNGHALDCHAPQDLAFRGDWGLTLQAVSNLLENASLYATPGTPIHLSAERAGTSVLLTVSDEGPGIPADDLPHIFERFYRGASQGDVRGSGLGLAIVKAMVELGGGRVAVESSPQGTSFTLSLPAAAGSP
ncbi:MAG: sensor histidine kinase [Tepidiformaceae bacterium]